MQLTRPLVVAISHGLLVISFFSLDRAAHAELRTSATLNLTGDGLSSVASPVQEKGKQRIAVLARGIGYELVPVSADRSSAVEHAVDVVFERNGAHCVLALSIHNTRNIVALAAKAVTSCDEAGFVMAIDAVFKHLAKPEEGGDWLRKLSGIAATRVARGPSTLSAESEVKSMGSEGPIDPYVPAPESGGGRVRGTTSSGAGRDTHSGALLRSSPRTKPDSPREDPKPPPVQETPRETIKETIKETPKQPKETTPKEPPKETRVRTAEGEKIITENGTIVIHDGDEAEAPRERPLRPPPATSGLKAGAADDNLQFNAYLRFLAQNSRRAIPHDVSRRVVVAVRDQNELPISNARVLLSSAGGKLLLERRTYADGRAMIFPSESTTFSAAGNRLAIEYQGQSREVPFQPGEHRIDVQLNLHRQEYSQVPIDVAFVMDTTGSMGDEIERLKSTIDVIHYQITQQVPRPDVRFGMVLYRDREDDYVTAVVPFTRDMMHFRYELLNVQAGGGGDIPEDVQAALGDTMTKLDWRSDGVHLAFLIGDAPPHLDYGQSYTYVHAMADAARRGIKIAAIGASGLPIEGETVWRQIAQYTMAPFVFLTHGESGDAEGSASMVSHHIGSNWVADNLDAIIIRVVKVELAHFAPSGAPARDDYFQASASAQMTSELVLTDLFQQSVKQLTDYAIERVDDRTPTLMLPVAAKEKQLRGLADKLESRLAFALTRDKAFRLVEKKNQEALLSALADQFAARYDASKLVEVGKMVPARLAISSELGTGPHGEFEMVVKLIRLETGEILSLSRLQIERALLM